MRVDICCGLAWGDEAKGKIVAQLAKSGRYSMVCRWAGGHNAGHTIYVNNKKYKTHLIPSGVFYDIPSIIGPDCVVNKELFKKEVDYLKENGFNTNLIKISSKTHVIDDTHIEEDKKKYVKSQGSTAKGTAPCYRDKFARLGKRVGDSENIDFFKEYLWDGVLYGNILCEGAQGFWLDINQGNYPYVTSSITLPYGACSLGFPMKSVENIYGAVKIYDTRSGIDPDFPDSLFEDEDLNKIGELGHEYGVTTQRKRKVNWLNLDKLIMAVNISGTTDLIISKTDILVKAELYKLFYHEDLHIFNSLDEMKNKINDVLHNECTNLESIVYSDNVEHIENLR